MTAFPTTLPQLMFVSTFGTRSWVNFKHPLHQGGRGRPGAARLPIRSRSSFTDKAAVYPPRRVGCVLGGHASATIRVPAVLSVGFACVIAIL